MSSVVVVVAAVVLDDVVGVVDVVEGVDVVEDVLVGSLDDGIDVSVELSVSDMASLELGAGSVPVEVPGAPVVAPEVATLSPLVPVGGAVEPPVVVVAELGRPSEMPEGVAAEDVAPPPPPDEPVPRGPRTPVSGASESRSPVAQRRRAPAAMATTRAMPQRCFRWVKIGTSTCPTSGQPPSVPRSRCPGYGPLGGSPAASSSRVSAASKTRDRMRKRSPNGASTENPLPRPGTTSAVSCVCFQYSN